MLGNSFAKKTLCVFSILFVWGQAWATVNFVNETSRFILKDSNAQIKFNQTTVSGWKNNSIVDKVSNVGFGDYNLVSDDANSDKILPYQGIPSTLTCLGWNIAANTVIHIDSNTVLNGNGNTINIGENSQLFVDDNVTLTLRNVTVRSNKNGVGNPAIKLASTRSRLALDNAKLDFANDFYFDRGKLFAYNDVNFSGTNAFIYRSTVPSYIKSGANLIFNTGTAFDFRPSTTGTPGLLAKDLLIMDDVDSKITFDGSSLKATLTGMRLTRGQILFDNKVSLTSAAVLKMTDNFTTVTSWICGDAALSVNWSPDRRYLAVGAANYTADLRVFRFTGTSLTNLPGCTKDFTGFVSSVNWSPDGKYLAASGDNSLNNIIIYSFNGSSLTQIITQNYGTFVHSVNWSPDGRYLAAGGSNGTEDFTIYSFNGLSLSKIATKDPGGRVYSVNWSPDSRYIALGLNAETTELIIYSFDGSSITQVTAKELGVSIYAANWSPDGKYLAMGLKGIPNTLIVYSFNGSSLTQINTQDLAGDIYATNWSPDGKYLAVCLMGAANNFVVYSLNGSSLTQITAKNFGASARAVDWTLDGKFLAVGGDNFPADLVIYNVSYGPETQLQNATNSIVFGNSVAGSSLDINLKLLSGANVELDGILNYDNINSTSIFSCDNSRFELKDLKSKIRMNPSTAVGWHDSSIVQKINGIGLGDYNLKQYDYGKDNTITYSEVSNSMQYVNWNIPANTAVHIQENIYMDGYGGTINIGENSQLFVDDNVTLTLRNVTVKSSKNGPGNPAIALASTRSRIALDNAKLDFANDFYFDRGNLFAYNDVNFTGTNAFVYRSTVPSYIKSGANFKFNTGTAFDFRPSTTGMPGLLAKDLLIMDDADSKITFDGSSLKSTLTGMRLTKGQILFDNKISLTSAAVLKMTDLSTTVTNFIFGTQAYSVNWSPDGRFLAVGGTNNSTDLRIFKFDGNYLTVIDSRNFVTWVHSLNWSPDGKYLAVGGSNGSSSLIIYSFNGSSLTQIAAQNFAGGVSSLNWGVDGKYLAVGGWNGTNDLIIYSFNGLSLTQITTQDFGSGVNVLNWSPDGKYLAVGGSNGTTDLIIYSFNGLTITPVVTSSFGAEARSLNWSPDGRYIAVGGNNGTTSLIIYSFNGSSLAQIVTKNVGSNVNALNWSADGKYLVAGGPGAIIYSFNGSSLLTQITIQYSGGSANSVNWSPDGKNLAVGGAYHPIDLVIYSVKYGPETLTQAVSNSIVLGNSVAGSASDITLKLLSGANVSVDGILNYDNVLGGTIFGNDNARFALKDSNSKIRMNPNIVVGWRDRSLIKNMVGAGLGDYNLRTYDTSVDKIVTYAESPGELVYDNSNSIVALNRTARTNSNVIMSWVKQTSNAAVQLDRRVRTNSNALMSWAKQTSNAAVQLDRRVRWNSNAIVYINNQTATTNILARTTSNAFLNAVKIYDKPQTYTTTTTVENLVLYKQGFSVAIDQTLTLSTPLAVSGPLNLNGTLKLGSDIYLNSDVTFPRGGYIDGNGKALHLGGNLTLTAGNIIHASNNMLIEGNGNTLILGDNSELIVDDNITVTLRNLTVKNSKNGVGNPPIKLASSRSKLALDNVTLDFANDFYFDCGQLFVYNDVNVTGTNSFIYRSTVPSYIKSGATLKFDPSSGFDFRPSTSGSPSQLAKDLITLDDAQSRLWINGGTLKSTQTGMRLTKGQLLLDNRVSLTSQAAQAINSASTTGGLKNPFTGKTSYGDYLFSLAWSPDGRYVVGATYDVALYGGQVKPFRFNKKNSTGGFEEVCAGAQDYGPYSRSVAWTCDGKYVVLGGNDGIIIYKFTGTGTNGGLEQAASGIQSFGPDNSVVSVSPSPDGKYVAVASGGNNSGYGIKVFKITATGNFGGVADIFPGEFDIADSSFLNLSWSPDGRYIVLGGSISATTAFVKLFQFVGNAAAGGVTQVGTGYQVVGAGTQAVAVSWSPDSRYVAVGVTDEGFVSGGQIQTYRVSGAGVSGGLAAIGTGARSLGWDWLDDLVWTPDGRYIVASGYTTGQILKTYAFTGDAQGGITPVGSGEQGTGTTSGLVLAISPDGGYVVVGNTSDASGTPILKAYQFDYKTDTQTQSIYNSIVLGNATAGSTSDLDVKLLSGANVSVDGLVNYDNVLGGTIFSNDNARFVLKNSNSKIRMNPNTVLGWRDRSLIKNLVNAGLGDYNLQTYDTNANKIVTYAESPGELVYDNSNAIVRLSATTGTLSINNSNAIVSLNNNQHNYVRSYNYVLKNYETVSGLARFNNGFTILPNQSANFDTCLSVSGGFDLRETGTLVLLGDLRLDGNTTLTSGGIIKGYGHSLILDGDLVLTSSNVLRILHIRGNTIIDGNGHSLMLGDNAQLFLDAGATLTLRNLTINGSQNSTTFPPVKLSTPDCKLALDNVTINAKGDFLFSKGQLFVHNDVNFTGDASFIYQSALPSYITSGGRLNFDPRSTFFMHPAAFTDCPYSVASTYTSNNFLVMQDNTSELNLNGCTFSVTHTGCRLTSGSLILDNRVYLDCNPATTLSSILTATQVGGTADVGNPPRSAAWSPNGKFLAVVNSQGSDTASGTLQLFSFNGSNAPTQISVIRTGQQTWSVSWSPDGKYIAIANNDVVDCTVKIYSFNGYSSPVQVGGSINTGVAPRMATWSPDGRFLAIITTSKLKMYSFDGTHTPTQIGGDVVTSSGLAWVRWSPNGKFLALVNTAAVTLQIFTFDGINTPTQIGSDKGTAVSPQCAEWSPDGRFIALASSGAGRALQMFKFNGTDTPVKVGQVSNILSTLVTWSPDGRYLAVVLNGGFKIFSFDGTGNPHQVAMISTNWQSIYGIAWSPDGNFIATAFQQYKFLQIFKVNYVKDTSAQSITNGLGLGNSTLGSLSDVDVRLLSGANVIVDGLLNIDNTQTCTPFDNEDARFVLKDNASKIMFNSKIIGWKDRSLVHGVDNVGLGDYDLTQYASNSDQVINFSDVTNEMTYGNWNISDNTSIHITKDTVVEGNGNTISLGDNSQLFVDTGVTLTLRNMVVRNSNNQPGNPAIKLAALNSKLALDNSTLNFVDDFYFDRGQLLVYNDVNFSGTSAFIYRSTVPSYIKSGANLKFNSGTTFDFRPSTTGTPGLLGKDLLIFDDETSKITLDGATLKSTLTGIRLTKGSLLLDNRVSLTSQTALRLTDYTSTVTNWQFTSRANSFAWHPTGKYVAVGADYGGRSNAIFEVLNFDGNTISPLTSVTFTATANSVDWSSDGKYLVCAGSLSPNIVAAIYSFDGTSLNPIKQITASSAMVGKAAKWSPDGRYVAVISGTPSSGQLTVYSFDGQNLTSVGSANSENFTSFFDVAWSPDGKYLVTGGSYYNVHLYDFTKSFLNPTPLQVLDGFADVIYSVKWSPDGRTLAIVGLVSDSLYVWTYSFSEPFLIKVLSDFYINYIGPDPSFSCCADWSMDGRYLAVCAASNVFDPKTSFIIYEYDGATLLQVGNAVESIALENACIGFSSDGKYIGITGDAATPPNQEFQIYSLNYGPEINTQAKSNSIVLGNSEIGSNADVGINLLSGANVWVDGILNYDNVNSTSIFSNDNARFVLKDGNSTICMNPNTVVGWQDRSIIKNITGAGLGDYNLQSYAGADKLVTYAEAPGELVYDNSNAIIRLNTEVSELPVQNSNAIKYLSDHFITVNDGKITVLGGITGTTDVSGRGFLSSPIDLQGGTLTLNSDMILSNQTTVMSSGNFDLQGNAIIFGGDLSFPSDVAIKIISSGVLDGQGNELRNAIGATLIVDNNVSLTLRNMNWVAVGSPQIEMRDASSKLTLQNLSTKFDRDYSFTQGQLFIQDDVFVTGTNKFSYVSTATSYVAPHSTLLFDKNTTFSYSPRDTSRHTLSERNLIKLADKTSEIYFNECTLQLPDSGWQLTNGTIYFDNKVASYGSTSQTNSFEWGDGTAAGELDVKVLSGAWLDDHGYIYHNPGN